MEGKGGTEGINKERGGRERKEVEGLGKSGKGSERGGSIKDRGGRESKEEEGKGKREKEMERGSSKKGKR